MEEIAKKMEDNRGGNCKDGEVEEINGRGVGEIQKMKRQPYKDIKE